MSSATPTWSDNVPLAGTLATPQTLAHGNRVKGTLDLRGKYAGYLFLRLGRLGTNAPSSVIQVLIRRVGNNGAVIHPGASVGLTGGNASGQATTVNADSSAGQIILNVASTLSFAAGDMLCIYDSGFTRLEFARVSRVSGSTLILDDEL